MLTSRLRRDIALCEFGDPLSRRESQLAANSGIRMIELMAAKPPFLKMIASGGGKQNFWSIL